MALESVFEISKEEIAGTVKHMASLMNCDYKTAYDKYTHTLVKMSATWEEIEPLLDSSY